VLFGVQGKVLARWSGGSTFYPGTVTAVRTLPSGGTEYSILYDDGVKETSVPGKFVKVAKL
jgi:hypothetical protein